MGLALLVGFELGRLALLVAQIVRHLCSKHPLVKPLGQLLHDPSRTGQIFRSLVARHQLFYDGRIDLRLLAFLALLYSLLLLGHFHLLSQVVTHTQILRHPRIVLRIRSLLPTLTALEAGVVTGLFKKRFINERTLLKWVADEMRVSEAMVVKIAKKLGFSGFRAFRSALAEYNNFPTTQLHAELFANDSAGNIVQKVVQASIKALVRATARKSGKSAGLGIGW